MKKFEIGTYRTYLGETEVIYHVEKVTAKTVVITIHKGGKYEKTQRCKIVENGINQYCEFKGMFFESDNDKIA